MDVITVETKAFKELMAKINVIANYVFSRQDDCKEDEDDIWVDSYEVCTFLKISDRTLQRLRSKGEIWKIQPSLPPLIQFKLIPFVQSNLIPFVHLKLPPSN